MIRSGWMPQFDDRRDFSLENPECLKIFSNLGHSTSGSSSVKKIDLRIVNEKGCFAEVEEQERRQNCSAIACASAIDFGDRKFLGQTAQLSSHAIYETSLQLKKLPIGSWMDLRSTLKAIKRFGAPPFWVANESPVQISPLISHGFQNETNGLLYFQATKNQNANERLTEIKSLLNAGLPFVFGFPIPSSIGNDPIVPYRPMQDSFNFGQAALAIGFDDNAISRGRGALLFKNSWGRDWGDSGYGWLPYEFVTNFLARDFWVVLKSDWLRE